MSTTNSTNMNLPIPVVGQEPGPDWASDLNASLTLIDAHNHTSGQGVAIPTDGISVNADFPLNNYNLTLVRSVRLAAQLSQPSLASDLLALYAYQGNLYFRDGSTNQVQITNLGAVAGTPGSITNLVSPASVTWVPGTSTFVFQSAANTPGNIDGASYVLRNLVASGFGLTLAPPTLSADYTITLPPLPASLAIATVSSAGVMGTTLPNATITNSGGALGVADASIGQTQIVAGFGLCPTGAILPFGGTAAPADYLLCDGTSYLRVSYPALFSAIGTAYGAADGTHFNVPQAQGYFMRGVSGTTSNDPDKASRTAMATGGNSGNNVGSVQADGFKAHIHNAALYDDTAGNGPVIKSNGNTFPNGNITTSSTGGNETRPLNFYVNFIIKT